MDESESLTQVPREMARLSSAIDHLETVVDESILRLASVMVRPGETLEEVVNEKSEELVPLAHDIRKVRARVATICLRVVEGTSRVEL